MSRHPKQPDTARSERHSLARWAQWKDLVRDERIGGAAMSLGALVAVAWASCSAHSYHALWAHRFHLAATSAAGVHLRAVGFAGIDLGSIGASLSDPRRWVDQGAMTLFFLAIGMELARERSAGMLAHLRHAVVPVVAAASGMAVAAGVYLLVAHSGPAKAGFGIPMATDIAFVAGAAGLLGRRLPASLRIFLVSLAVADDIGSVAVLAVVSGERVSPLPLLALAVLLALSWPLRRRVLGPWPAVALVAPIWVLLAMAHVEPALAGVLAGVLVPPGTHRLEREVAAISAWVVLPAFALANAGVDLSRPILASEESVTVFAAILLARVAGKTLGVGLGATGAVWATQPRVSAIETSVAPLSASPKRMGRVLPGATSAQLLGASSLTGMGFTVPLLFARISFASHPLLLASAKAGLLAGSLASGLAGTAVLSLLAARAARAAKRADGIEPPAASRAVSEGP